MKKKLLILLLILLGGFSVKAQTITFDDQGHSDDQALGNPYSINNNGETFRFTLNNSALHRYETIDNAGCGSTAISHLSAGYLSATTWTIETLSGNEINLGTIRFDNVFGCSSYTYSLSIQGFKNGSSTGTQLFDVTGINTTFTSNASFDDVDKIVITCTDLTNLGIDNINWASICTNPTVPTVTASANTVCSGGSTTLNISGNLNSATQWAIYTGSCGGTLVGTTTASTFNTGTLSANTTYYVRGEGGCTTAGTCGTRTITVSTITSSISSQTNIACNGGATGAATVSASSGTTPYTYLWSNGATTAAITGLAAGTYTCTITDANGCTKTQSAIITQPTAITSSISSQTNVSCNAGTNGTATVSASGGTAGYTYLWNNAATTATITGLAAGTYTCTITDANGCTKTQSATITQPTAISLNLSSLTNISCFGGSNGAASVASATGGTAPYTYNWTPGNPSGDGTTSVTGLTAGTWTCTTTDANGCTKATNVTITQPTALAASISSQNNVSCNGGSNGSATVSASGGTSPYSYLWSNAGTTATITGLTAGTYNVTITDANGCTKAINVTITQPTAITSSISSQTNVSCNGGTNGSAAVSAGGGTAPYTYSWSNGATTATITGLAAGTYTCTITDANGCTKSQSATLTQPMAITSSISSQTNVSCNGGTNGSAAVSAGGGTAPYTYLWSNGAATASVTELAAGTYNCYITDANGCIKIQEVIITQPTAINTEVTQTTGVLTATQSGATYQWYTCPNALIVGATSQSYTPTIVGDYKVAITVGSCTIESNCVTVSSTLGINDFEATSKPLFLVFPNPTSGVLNVKSSFDGRFKVYNLLGQAKMSFDFVSDKENSFSMESLPAGIYFLKGTNGDKIYSEKILLKK